MTVKKVTTDQEKQDALRIRQEVFVQEQHVAPELEWDEFDDLPSTLMFVDYAEDGTALAAGRFRVTEGYGKVERICTQKAARKQGAAKRVMEAIEYEARMRGLPQLKLGAQITAIPFYEKLGYHVISDSFLDANIPHKMMAKTLAYES
ncbi:GNAT family N-acetyltransferase [Listeria costaricensis]|uniref:GNAT family N-acetyltransferase n=1 Tax=Listeria costaricensis TaxID=2026604 RepID=UPI000C06B57E|nr:GNAT family N-acetyltransferase [Listeria costaricensis]